MTTLSYSITGASWELGKPLRSTHNLVWPQNDREVCNDCGWYRRLALITWDGVSLDCDLAGRKLPKQIAYCERCAPQHPAEVAA